MRVHVSTLKIPGAGLEGENPLPYFRDPEKNKPVGNDGSMQPEELEGFGHEIGYRVLPYRLQDRYSRKRQEIQLKTVILENDFLRAEFLAEYGGRLYSLFDKVGGRELLFRNPVFQPANLAIRNAWFSGGIEWNIGQFGHAFLTCEPLFFARCKDGSGNAFLRAYEYERCKGVYYQMDFHLPTDSRYLCAYIRIVNDTDRPVPMYWWTNIAVPEKNNVRVFSPTDDVIFIKPDSIDNKGAHSFGYGILPNLPSMPQLDASFPLNSPYANEFFYQIPADVRAPWEAAVYNDGSVFLERSTSLLHYRKMFCWGNHRGGRRWRDFLSNPGEGDYVEIQGGIARTQVHSLEMPAGAVWEFTQLFGGFSVEAEGIFGEYGNAKRIIADCVDKVLPEDAVLKLHECFKAYADCEPQALLCYGSGWGALEKKSREKFGEGLPPKGLIFPEDSISSAQKPWVSLLEKGFMDDIGKEAVPESWMIDCKWQSIFTDSMEENPQRINATALLHLGVMLYENGDREWGLKAWRKSISLKPTAIAYRNIAYAKLQSGHLNEALEYMEKSIGLTNGKPDRAFIEEYFDMLIKAGRYEQVLDLFEALPFDMESCERIRMLAGVAALECGKLGYVEGLFTHEFAVIREGETLLSDLWYRYIAMKMAKQEGIPLTDELVGKVKAAALPPRNIDFRMVADV